MGKPVKIALFGGSFNPPHIGHIWVAQQLLESKIVDLVWLVPNFSSQSYSKKQLVDAKHRIEMCKLLIHDFDNFSNYGKICASETEIRNKFSYSYELIEHFTKRFPNAKFYFIVGSDWNINKFKNYQKILKMCKVIVMHRGGYKNTTCKIKQLIDFKISSTEIRRRILDGQTIKGLTSQSVEKYIYQNKLYSK